MSKREFIPIGEHLVKIPDGMTAEEFLKSSGLNPIHWQKELKGVTTMEDQDRSFDELEEGLNSEGLTLKKKRKERSDKGKTKVDKITPPVATKRRKSRGVAATSLTITPDDVGNYFLNPNGLIFQCTEVQTEPSIKMVDVVTKETIETVVSDFKYFVRLVPDVAPKKKR